MLQSLVEERIGDAENYPRNGAGVAGGKLLEICVVYCVEGPIICHEPKGVNQGRDGLNGGGGVNYTVLLNSLEEIIYLNSRRALRGRWGENDEGLRSESELPQGVHRVQERQQDGKKGGGFEGGERAEWTGGRDCHSFLTSLARPAAHRGDVQLNQGAEERQGQVATRERCFPTLNVVARNLKR